MSSSNKLTIGIVSADYDSPKGGLGIAMQSLAEMLRESDIVVRICTSANQRHHLLFSANLQRRLKSFIESEKPDALIMPVGPGGMLAPYRIDVPFIAIAYHTYAQQARLVPGQWWKKVFVPFEQRTLRRAAGILCYAEESRDALQRQGLAPNRVHLLPQPINRNVWKPQGPKKPGFCMCVVRLDGRKGVETVLRAWPSVEREIPHARLVIVGDGPRRNRVDRLLERCQRATRIARLPVEELRRLTATAELALCPAYLEGFGLAAAEAMASGTTVVAADADGLRSLLDGGRCGILVRPGDSVAWARAVADALRDQERCVRLAETALRRMQERHDPVRAREAHMHTILDILGRVRA